VQVEINPATNPGRGRHTGQPPGPPGAQPGGCWAHVFRGSRVPSVAGRPADCGRLRRRGYPPASLHGTRGLPECWYRGWAAV